MNISFSKEELLRFANIFDNAGQVFLAGLVIAPFFSGIDFTKTFVIILGMLLTLGCWFFSWWLTKEANKL
jgi:hypothetical protein